MTTAPEQFVVSALYGEARRIRVRVPTSRWFFFGSITTPRRPVGDVDLLVVSKSAVDCRTVRDELAAVCSLFPIHLLLMTAEEEEEVGFIVGEGAVEIDTGKPTTTMSRDS